MINNFSIELNLNKTALSTNIICLNFSIEFIVKNQKATNNTLCTNFSLELGDPFPQKVFFIREK